MRGISACWALLAGSPSPAPSEPGLLACFPAPCLKSLWRTFFCLGYSRQHGSLVLILAEGLICRAWAWVLPGSMLEARGVQRWFLRGRTGSCCCGCWDGRVARLRFCWFHLARTPRRLRARYLYPPAAPCLPALHLLPTVAIPACCYLLRTLALAAGGAYGVCWRMRPHAFFSGITACSVCRNCPPHRFKFCNTLAHMAVGRWDVRLAFSCLELGMVIMAVAVTMNLPHYAWRWRSALQTAAAGVPAPMKALFPSLAAAGLSSRSHLLWFGS